MGFYCILMPVASCRSLFGSVVRNSLTYVRRISRAPLDANESETGMDKFKEENPNWNLCFLARIWKNKYLNFG